jgi:hypothetical protein
MAEETGKTLESWYNGAARRFETEFSDESAAIGLHLAKTHHYQSCLNWAFT